MFAPLLLSTFFVPFPSEFFSLLDVTSQTDIILHSSNSLLLVQAPPIPPSFIFWHLSFRGLWSMEVRLQREENVRGGENIKDKQVKGGH